MVPGIFEPYELLERRFAGFTGSEYAVSCSTGTSALHLALMALGVGPGDEVIVPDFTMAACAFAVSYTGAKPVFADVNIHNYSLKLEDVKQRITDKTKAIMVVHVYGRVADITPLKELGLPIIEDASEAHGAVYNSVADLTCYSFYRNKIIHGEEGGIVTTNNEGHVRWINLLKNMAFTPSHDYYHPFVGYNYRLSNAHADLILDSLEDYEENNKKRRQIEEWYDELFHNPLEKRQAVWFYEAIGQNPLQHLGMRHAFKPMTSLPPYLSEVRKNARSLSQSLVLFPADPRLDKKDVRKIVEAWKTTAS